jgi:hypothetical protein
LRSQLDRVDREDVLPRLGAKTYRRDFGLPDLGVFVEAKFIGEKGDVAVSRKKYWPTSLIESRSVLSRGGA